MWCTLNGQFFLHTPDINVYNIVVERIKCGISPLSVKTNFRENWVWKLCSRWDNVWKQISFNLSWIGIWNFVRRKLLLQTIKCCKTNSISKFYGKLKDSALYIFDNDILALGKSKGIPSVLSHVAHRFKAISLGDIRPTFLVDMFSSQSKVVLNLVFLHP